MDSDTIHTSESTTPTPPAPPIGLMPAPEVDLLEANNQLNRQLIEARGLISVLQTERKAFDENQLICALRTADGGAVLADSGDALRELCETILERQTKGTFQLTFSIRPFKDNGLIFDALFAVKPPKPEGTSDILFLDDKGHLTRRDPRQGAFQGEGF